MSDNLIGRLIRETNPEAALAALPDSVTLAERYCGMKLYPRQKTILRMVNLELEHLTDYDKMVIDEWMESTVNGGDVQIPTDFYERAQKCKDRGYRRFREVINCFGRRAGKGFIGGVMGTKLMLELVALGDPQGAYGIDEGKTIASSVVATTVSQAQRLLFADIKNTIARCTLLRPYLSYLGVSVVRIKTPFDISMSDRLSSKLRGSQERATLEIRPMAANSSTGRGDAAYFQMFDEFAFLSSGDSSISSEEVYQAYTPSLDQFGKDGFIYIPSSPYTEVGKFYELYNDAFARDEFGHAKSWNMLCLRMPSWAPYEGWEYDKRFKGAIQYSPDVNEEMRLLEERDPEKFKVERRAHFQSVMDAYLPSELVDKIFLPVMVDGKDINVEHKVGRIDRAYEAHGDAAKVGDNFCYAIGHGETMPDGTVHAFIDLMLVWQASDFRENDDPQGYMDYNEIYDQIAETLKQFYINRLSFDQFDSTMMLQRLQKDVMEGRSFNPSCSVAVENFTAASNLQRYERFKTAVYQGWVHAPDVIHQITGIGKVNLLKHELKFLVRKNNRIDHPPGGHNDMSDCVSVIVNRIIGDQIAAFESGLMSLVDGAGEGGFALDAAYADNDTDRIIARGQALMQQWMGADFSEYGEYTGGY